MKESKESRIKRSRLRKIILTCRMITADFRAQASYGTAIANDRMILMTTQGEMPLPPWHRIRLDIDLFLPCPVPELQRIGSLLLQPSIFLVAASLAHLPAPIISFRLSLHCPYSPRYSSRLACESCPAPPSSDTLPITRTIGTSSEAWQDSLTYPTKSWTRRKVFQYILIVLRTFIMPLEDLASLPRRPLPWSSSLRSLALASVFDSFGGT